MLSCGADAKVILWDWRSRTAVRIYSGHFISIGACDIAFQVCSCCCCSFSLFALVRCGCVLDCSCVRATWAPLLRGCLRIIHRHASLVFDTT